ncbi:MAG: TadG family pilus assembly protein, partial [Tepidisphaeraceae bacterium]
MIQFIATRKDNRSRRRAHAFTMLYLGVGMVVLLAIMSLAIDLGRVQLAKTELRCVADAAARAGAAVLVQGGSDAEVRAAAAQLAAQNTVDGKQALLRTDSGSGDVEIGNWNSLLTPRFSTTRGPKNAVRINGILTSERGNAVPLLFAMVIGRANCDVHASATATSEPESGYGMVGLDHILMKGNTMSSYWSDGSGPAGDQGDVASNGDIALGGNSQIQGNAWPGPGGAVSDPSKVTGSST